MPELPEVETIRKTLEKMILQKTIEKVSIFWPKIIKFPQDLDQFQKALEGQTIRKLDRRGKYLIFYTDDFSLISHLRMEGRYGFFQQGEEKDKHTHIIFHMTDGTELRYRDVRKFGTMHLFHIGEEFNRLPLSKLGPEPFSSEFTNDYLEKALKKTARTIKATLLDQKVVSGLGNIYVDEALFRSRIHPERKASSLLEDEIRLLHKEIISTLKEAVEMGGSTIRSYVNSQGEIGMFQLQLYAYGRNGEPCKVCSTPLEKKIVSGRGTHFCPNCQTIEKGR